MWPESESCHDSRRRLGSAVPEAATVAVMLEQLQMMLQLAGDFRELHIMRDVARTGIDDSHGKSHAWEKLFLALTVGRGDSSALLVRGRIIIENGHIEAPQKLQEDARHVGRRADENEIIAADVTTKGFGQSARGGEFH